MDKIKKYQDIVKQYMKNYAALLNAPPPSKLETMLALDDEHGQYMLLRVGWTDRERVRRTIIHVRLRDAKFWIEEDWTEDGIATELLRQGVPREDIVLGFQPPEMRSYTEFATA